MNGLAFCAIFHHFRPRSIDPAKLDPVNSKTNLRQAFEASDQEAIMRVVDYCDILNKKSLDQLSVMTYLYQIKNHFEAKPIAPIAKPKFADKLATLPNLISTPVYNKVVARKYENPFEQTGNNSSNPFEQDTDADQTEINVHVSTCRTSGLLEIKPDGKIVDVLGDFKQTNGKIQTIFSVFWVIFEKLFRLHASCWKLVWILNF